MSKDAWERAWSALVIDLDQRPLAEMMAGSDPVPPWIREYLGKMLHPDTNFRDADRLVFQRSNALKAKMKTNENQIAAGLAVIDLEARGEITKNAIAHVMERLHAKERYVREAKSLAIGFPDYYKAAAQNSPVFRAAVEGWMPRKTVRDS